MRSLQHQNQAERLRFRTRFPWLRFVRHLAGQMQHFMPRQKSSTRFPSFAASITRLGLRSSTFTGRRFASLGLANTNHNANRQPSVLRGNGWIVFAMTGFGSPVIASN
jgi:hypothetical protein